MIRGNEGFGSLREEDLLLKGHRFIGAQATAYRLNPRRSRPGPAFGNRLVHFFDRHGLARSVNTTLHVHDRTGLPETLLAVFTFDETDVIARFEVKVFGSLRRMVICPSKLIFAKAIRQPQEPL